MWHAMAVAASADAVIEALASLHERGALRQLTFVVQTQVRARGQGGASPAPPWAGEWRGRAGGNAAGGRAPP